MRMYLTTVDTPISPRMDMPVLRLIERELREQLTRPVDATHAEELRVDLATVREWIAAKAA